MYEEAKFKYEWRAYQKQVLDDIQGKQQGERGQVDATELQRQGPAQTVEHRVGRPAEKAYDRVVRVGTDPGDQSPGDDQKNIDLKNQVDDLIHGTPGEMHAASRKPVEMTGITTCDKCYLYPSDGQTVKSFDGS